MKPSMRHAAAAAIAAFFALACGRGGNQIRIGSLVPLTGESAPFGHALRQGMELAVEEWNAQGGVRGRKVQLVLADDMGDPAEGAAACTRLIERNRCVAILGPALSRVALAAAPIAQTARIPLLTPSASDPRVTEAGDYVFRSCYIDPFQGALGARFAFEDLGARRAACLFDGSSDYSRGLCGAFKAAFTSRGGRIVGEEAHGHGATDFRPHLQRILPAHPEVLYLPDFAPDVALAAREACALGFRGTFLGGDGWDAPGLARSLGDLGQGAFFTTHCCQDSPDPRVQAFATRHQARFQKPPTALSILGYDAAWVLMDALVRAGTTDGPALRRALQDTDLRAVSGPIRFDAQRNPRKPGIIMEIREGRPVYLTTVDPPAGRG